MHTNQSIRVYNQTIGLGAQYLFIYFYLFHYINLYVIACASAAEIQNQLKLILQKNYTYEDECMDKD